MAVIRWTFPSGNNGDTLTAPLAGADTTNFAAGTPTLSNAQVLAGMNTLSARFTNDLGGHLWYAKESLSATAYAYDVYYYTAARANGVAYVAWAGLGSSGRSLGVIIGGSTNTISFNDSTGTIWTSGAESYPDNTWIRFSVYGTCGAGTGTGRLAWYAGHSTTPMGDTGLLTNISTQVSIDRIRIGSKAASSAVTGGEFYVGSWAYDPAATGLIPPFSSGTALIPWLRSAGTWIPGSMRERDTGAWSPRTPNLK